LQNVQQQWASSCGQAFFWPIHNYGFQQQQRMRQQSDKQGNQATNKPESKNATQASDSYPQYVHDDIAERLRKADDTTTEALRDALPRIESAHRDAIARMQAARKDEHALTLAEKDKDQKQYADLVQAASTPLTVKQLEENKFDQNRFQPLLTYLQTLDEQLRTKYSEYSTQQ
jgi:hypothetical protein